MQPYQQRVVDEKSELDGRVQRLSEFLETDLFRGLPPGEQDRMSRQLKHMRAYSEVLGERIDAF